MSEPALSVILPTRDRLPALRRTLEAYERQVGAPPFEVVVVDDGSGDGTWEWLRAREARAFALRAARQEREGPASARNRALGLARGDLLLLTGDDILPSPGLLAGHVAAHRGPDAPRFVLGRLAWDPERPVTPVMRHVDGFGAQQFRYAWLRDGCRLGFACFYASNLSLRREALAGIDGPFDPAFGGAAFEDGDLGYRLMGDRRQIVYRSSLLAFHDHPHDLRSFARRQQRAGRAAAALARKHPELSTFVGLARVAPLVEDGRSPRVPDDDAIDAGEEALLATFSSHEPAGRWRDRLYMALFWYFYARGLLEAQFPGRPLAGPLGRLLERDVLWAVRGSWPSLGAAARRSLGPLVVGRELGATEVLRDLRWRLAVRSREAHYRVTRWRVREPR